MPQYIVLVNFTDQGRKGVKEIPNRQDKSRETAKQFGVERKSVWMTFGPYDFVHLYEAPNDDAMAKIRDDPQFLWQSSDDCHGGMGRVRTPSAHTRIACERLGVQVPGLLGKGGHARALVRTGQLPL